MRGRDSVRGDAGRGWGLGARSRANSRAEGPLRGPGDAIGTECPCGRDEEGIVASVAAYEESEGTGSGAGLDGASRMTKVTTPPMRGALRGENSTRT